VRASAYDHGHKACACSLQSIRGIGCDKTIRAANPLPAVTVTGHVKTTQEPDAVSRDWAERSPEIHWPTPMFNGAAEIFAHNQIMINAFCEAYGIT
jgi:hypothetical protein